MVHILDRFAHDRDDKELGRIDNFVRLVEQTFLRTLLGCSFVGFAIAGIILTVLPVRFASETDSNRNAFLINVQETGRLCIEISAWLVGASGALSIGSSTIRYLTAKTAIAPHGKTRELEQISEEDLEALATENESLRAELSRMQDALTNLTSSNHVAKQSFEFGSRRPPNATG